jgi:hypothetical protein
MCQESPGSAFFNYRARRAERLFNQLIYLIIFIHNFDLFSEGHRRARLACCFDGISSSAPGWYPSAGTLWLSIQCLNGGLDLAGIEREMGEEDGTTNVTSYVSG